MTAVAIASSTPATLEQFKCELWRSWMTRESCAERHAETRTTLGGANGPSRGIKITSGHCSGCEMGAQHLAGTKPDRWPGGELVKLRVVNAPPKPKPTPDIRRRKETAPPRPAWMPPVGAPPTTRQLRALPSATRLPNRSAHDGAELRPAVNAGDGQPGGAPAAPSTSSDLTLKGVTAGETAPPTAPASSERPKPEEETRMFETPTPTAPPAARKPRRRRRPKPAASEAPPQLAPSSELGAFVRERVEELLASIRAAGPVAALERLGFVAHEGGTTPTGARVLFVEGGDA